MGIKEKEGKEKEETGAALPYNFDMSNIQDNKVELDSSEFQ